MHMPHDSITMRTSTQLIVQIFENGRILSFV